MRRSAFFSSFIHGEERPKSDVDVLVTFRKGEDTFDRYIDCKFYLEDLFGRKVDLVTKGAILLYWQIGDEILVRQEQEGWGSKVIDRLSSDLTHEFPAMKGFSSQKPEIYAEICRGLA